MWDIGQTPLVGMISLGCAKNLVDSEIILGSAKEHGFEVTDDLEKAHIVVVNTCGFIEPAKEESINAILTARQHEHQKLVVAGCLSQRYRAELETELPEVDAFIGLDDVAIAGSLFHSLLNGEKPTGLAGLLAERSKYIPDFDTPRYRLTASHTAYVKIAEGCNHPCTFCVIPKMRGSHRSRTVHSVVSEARRLVNAGVRELNLISQDTTYFGMDLWPKRPGPRQPIENGNGPTLATLLDALGEIEGDFWIRLLYTHPAHWGDELIRAIARNPKVARYVDMPLQHIHDDMLATMRRETSRKYIEELIIKLREGIPGLAIRTTFIVGFPGETEEHFECLLEFIRRVRFERLGIFKYSKEEGSRAALMDGQVSERVKASRLKRAMLDQQRIAAEKAREARGQRMRVLADTEFSARTEHDAPDVDGKVILTRPVKPGEFHEVVVTGSETYDLVAEPV